MVPCRESTNLMNLMKTKEEIVANWLPRYTKRNLEDFGEYILLTNFNKYVEIFAEKFNVPILGRDANMISASAEGITIINFGMGSPNAAIIMDLLSAIHPKACLFLGKCGGIDKHTVIAVGCPSDNNSFPTGLTDRMHQCIAICRCQKKTASRQKLVRI